MLLEAVLVATLLLADLAVPAQALQAFRLHLVGDIFRAADFGFGHGGGVAGGDAQIATGLIMMALSAALYEFGVESVVAASDLTRKAVVEKLYRSREALGKLR